MSARNILCVRLDSLGDVLMTTPAMRALRQSGPAGRRLGLLGSPGGAAVAQFVPEIDEAIAYEAPWLKGGAASGRTEMLAVADRMASRGYDAAIIFTTYTQSALPAAMLCQLAGIPRRLAYSHENPYQLLTDWIPDPEPVKGIRHEVERQLDLVGARGAFADDRRLSLRVSADSRRLLEGKLAGHLLDTERPWVVVHPGASAPSRRYPPELFAIVVKSLAESAGLQVVFTGDASEVEIVDHVRELAGVPALSLAGRLTLGETAALIERAPLLVANNTGPVHIAAALGTPVVVLYALTNPQHTPWSTQARVLFQDVPCRNCLKSVCPFIHHACLRGVSPADVVQAARELLSPRGSEGTTDALPAAAAGQTAFRLPPGMSPPDR